MHRTLLLCAVTAVVVSASKPAIRTSKGSVTISGETDVCLNADGTDFCVKEQLEKIATINAAIAAMGSDLPEKIAQNKAAVDTALATGAAQNKAALASTLVAAGLDASQKVDNLGVGVVSQLSALDTKTENAAAKLETKVMANLEAMLAGTAACFAKGLAYDTKTNKCDINECFDGTHKCSADSTCVNTVGSHDCQCNTGFVNGNDDDKCRPFDICGADMPKGACSGEGQFCVPDYSDVTKFECACITGYKREVKNGAFACSGQVLTKFPQAVQNSYISQFFYEGWGFARDGHDWRTEFWKDSCVTGGNALKHSVDCGSSSHFISKYCRDNWWQDTNHEYNWFEFHLDQPLGIKRWRMRGRDHSASYMGEVKLKGLDENTHKWVTLQWVDKEPGRCTWQDWNTNAALKRGRYKYFRLSLGRNNRGAYASFAAVELDIASTQKDTYRATTFQEAVATTTYAPQFVMEKEIKGQPPNDPKRLWDDECQRGGLGFHGMNGVHERGESWIKWDMKFPVTLIGIRVKARNNRWPSYMGQVDLYGSRNGGVVYEHLFDEYKKAEAGECHVTELLSVRTDMAIPMNHFKLDIFNPGAAGYIAAAQFIFYIKSVTWKQDSYKEGLINYWPFEGKTPLKSVAGKKSTAESRSDCNDVRASATPVSGSYAHRLTASERSGGCASGRAGGLFKGGWRFPTGGKQYTSFTISFWWRPHDFGCHSTSGVSGCAAILLPHGDWAGTIGYYGSANAINMGRMHVNGNDWAGFYLTANKWYHFTLVATSVDSAYLYVGGSELIGTHTTAGGAYKMGPSSFVANYEGASGGNANEHYGRGDVDEFAMWDRALSPEEVGEAYRQSKGGNHMGFV